MKAEERARQFFRAYRPPDAQWYVDEVLVVGLADALLAHAAECYEKACKTICPFCAHGKPLIYDVEIGWYHQYEGEPESDSSCFAAALRALAREE